MASKRPRSSVWSYFKREGEGEYAVCQVSGCRTKIKFCNNTSNLLKHLKTKHIKEHTECLEERRANEQQTQKKTKLPQPKIEQANIERKEDPLKWWKENQYHFPRLQKIAQKYLCIPGSSVPSERLFSKAGILVSERRNRIKPKNVDTVLFLNQNLD